MGLKTWLGKRLGMRKVDGWLDLPNRIANPYLAQKRLLSNKTTPLIFDVGAHHGESAIGYREKFPEALIYSFEPTPDSFAILVSDTAQDKRVRTWQLAFSDKPGKITFYCNRVCKTNSMLVGCCASTQLNSVIELEATTLDLFCEKQQISQIDILKIDAQGADLKVLQGAQKMLEQRAIDVVFTEATIQPSYEKQASLDEICAYMRSCGYQFCNMLGEHYAEDGTLSFCDLLFRKPI